MTKDKEVLTFMEQLQTLTLLRSLFKWINPPVSINQRLQFINHKSNRFHQSPSQNNQIKMQLVPSLTLVASKSLVKAAVSPLSELEI